MDRKPIGKKHFELVFVGATFEFEGPGEEPQLAVILEINRNKTVDLEIFGFGGTGKKYSEVSPDHLYVTSATFSSGKIIVATEEFKEEVSLSQLVVQLYGRFTFTFHPISDFTVTLAIEKALRDTDKLANVSLADFVDEKVTFRVEISPMTSLSDIAREIRSRLDNISVMPISTNKGVNEVSFQVRPK